MSEVELVASMDAWLHTEAGLDNMTRAQYTQQELDRLQLGYLLREHDATLGDGGSGQRREIRRGQQEARQEMLDDLGFH